MLWRTTILRGALFVVRSSVDFLNTYNRRASAAIIQKINEINSHGIVFFTKGDNRRTLNEAMLYVRNNELTKRLRVVHVYDRVENIPAHLGHDLAFLDEVYEEIEVEFVTVQGKFGPEMIERLSREWGIAKNYMFIGSPSGKLPYRLSELGGVRLII
jgi:hypothetical protein